MPTAVLESVEDIDLTEGNSFSMDLVVHNGKLMVQSITARPTTEPKKGADVDEFLHFCATHGSGALSDSTDAELDALLRQRLNQKHLR